MTLLDSSTTAVRRKYAEVAARYDRMEALPDRLLLRGLRRQLLSRAQGRVLEVGIGTGRNIPHYPAGCTVVGADLSEAMLREARRRAQTLAPPTALCQMDAEALAFPDATFDTVLCTLALCTIPDPIKAAREMARVCRPSGRLLFLEHVRSRAPWVAWLQDRLAPWQLRSMCCRLNQDTQELLRSAGLQPVVLQDRLLGIFVLLEAQAPRSN